MKKFIPVALGLFGVLIGVGLILPALAKVRDLGAMPSAVVLPYSLGIALLVLSICTMAVGMMKRKVT